MADHFLRLPLSEQAEVLNGLAPELGRKASVLEKDVWVCWVLQQLFQMPERLPMAFKGGTSLSKVFNAINRFSEDIDVTLDYRCFNTGVDPFDPKISNSKVKKLSKTLKGLVSDHANGLIVPYLKQQLCAEVESSQARVEANETAAEVRIYYPSTIDPTSGYLRDSVLIEFGGRNITEPNTEHHVRPYIAEYLTNLVLPMADVTVLSPARTFWEKATLIHVECHRPELKADANRQSRHWCDLAVLADHDIGRDALANRNLLADVVKHKNVFFRDQHANYDACLSGKLRLVPDDALLRVVDADLRAMIDGGMFYGERPSFEKIIERLRALEGEINSTAA